MFLLLLVVYLPLYVPPEVDTRSRDMPSFEVKIVFDSDILAIYQYTDQHVKSSHESAAKLGRPTCAEYQSVTLECSTSTISNSIQFMVSPKTRSSKQQPLPPPPAATLRYCSIVLPASLFQQMSLRMAAYCAEVRRTLDCDIIVGIIVLWESAAARRKKSELHHQAEAAALNGKDKVFSSMVHLHSVRDVAHHVLHSAAYFARGCDRKKLRSSIQATVVGKKKADLSDFKKIYSNMLSEVANVTDRRATTIATAFPTIHSLVSAVAQNPAAVHSKIASLIDYGESRKLGALIARSVCDALTYPCLKDEDDERLQRAITEFDELMGVTGRRWNPPLYYDDASSTTASDTCASEVVVGSKRDRDSPLHLSDIDEILMGF